MPRSASLSLAVALVLSVAPAAEAQVKKTVQTDDGYLAEFLDDPLGAGGMAAEGWVLRVRPIAARSTLIRPRTSLVMEMLKSADHL